MTDYGAGNVSSARWVVGRIRAGAKLGRPAGEIVDLDEIRILVALPSGEFVELIPLLMRTGSASSSYGNAVVKMVAMADIQPEDVPVDDIIDEWLADRPSLELDHTAWILGRAGIDEVTLRVTERMRVESQQTRLMDLLAASGKLRLAPAPVLGAGPSSSGGAVGGASWRALHGRPPLPPPDSTARNRFANVLAVEAGSDDRVHEIRPDADLRVRVDIGELAATDVKDPEPLPEDQLPDADLWLDLMFTSLDFIVGTATGKEALHARLLLPLDKTLPATTESGERYVYFPITAPTDRSVAQARLGVYYRDALVQSFRLTADLQSGQFEIDRDFTVSKSLAHLAEIEERPRVSIFLNDNGDGMHTLVLRPPGEDRAGGKPFLVGEGSEKAVEKLREELHKRSPKRRGRSKADLVKDLRALAPAGNRMYQSFKGGLEDELVALRRDPDIALLSISRPTTSKFSLPWGLVYDIGLDAKYMAHPQQLRLCPLVDDWDGNAAMIEGAPRHCPREQDVSHTRNLLCPFGFWGIRYSIESTSTRDSTGMIIRVPDAPLVAVSITQEQVDRKRLDQHIEDLETLFGQRLGSATEVGVAKDRKTTFEHLGTSLSLLYFYCHGQKADDDAETYLAIGKNEPLPPGDYLNMVEEWMLNIGHRPWRDTEPLVFINACHSLEIQPETTISYVDAFVASGRAAGVIGTEVRINQDLAMEFAERFFEWLLGSDPETRTVDDALRRTRLEFLASGNLFGLVYTPHCWADLRFEGLA